MLPQSMIVVGRNVIV